MKLDFNEEEHKYFYNGVEFISVTTLVGDFFEKFNADKVAESISKRDGKLKEDILKEWKDKGDKAREFGTEIHFIADCLCKDIEVKESNLKNDEIKYKKVLDKFFKEHKNLYPIYSEKQICLPPFNLAGTVDLIMRSKDGKLFIYDWKTNKSIDQYSKYKKRLLKPFDYLEDCNFIKYAFQLNMYAYMLEKTEGLKSDGLYIIHLNEDSYKEYKCPNLREEVKLILQLRGNDLDGRRSIPE